MSFNEWHRVSIKDVFELIPGFAFKSKDFSENGIPVIKIKNVKALRLLDRDFSYIDPKYLETKSRFTTKKGDLLISMTGNRIEGSMSSWVGKVCRINSDKKYLINQRVGILRLSNESYSDKFFLYLLGSEEIQKKLISIATSSGGQANISPDQIKSLEFSIPCFEEQNAIAHILSTLDEKIEVNNRINKTLEDIAQAIFKQWFVDFEFPNEDGEPYKSSGGEMVESELGMIPKGWEVGTLNDVIDFQNGYAFKSKDLLDENIGNCYHVFKMGHINKGGGLNKEGTKSYVLKKDYEDLPRYILKKGDLLMCMTDMKSNVALLGHTALMDEDNKYILNQRVGLLRIKDEKKLDYPFVYVLTNSNDFLEGLRSRANSGVQVNLSTKEIKESQLIIPGEKTHELFNNIAKALFEEYFNLGKENDQLISLRDALLPKLMSGEIRVPLDEEGAAS